MATEAARPIKQGARNMKRSVDRALPGRRPNDFISLLRRARMPSPQSHSRLAD